MDKISSNPNIFKKALNNLLQIKDYHVATPIKKIEMLNNECMKILNKNAKE